MGHVSCAYIQYYLYISSAKIDFTVSKSCAVFDRCTVTTMNHSKSMAIMRNC